MAILALIIGSLALVAATVSVALTVTERKRSRKQNAAYVETVRNMLQEHRTALEEFVLKQVQEMERVAAQKTEEMQKAIGDMQKNVEQRLSNLVGGVIPDYEKAKQAAKAVNDFSAGISGILGFDPMEALKQSREKDGEG